MVKLSKTFLFQTIQFNISMPLVLFNPKIGPYQVLPCWARVDLGAMAMKGCSAFPKAPASQEPPIRLFSVIFRTVIGRIVRLFRGAVGVFYSPS